MKWKSTKQLEKKTFNQLTDLATGGENWQTIQVGNIQLLKLVYIFVMLRPIKVLN